MKKLQIKIAVDNPYLTLDFEDLNQTEKSWECLTSDEKTELISEYIDNLEMQPIVIVDAINVEIQKIKNMDQSELRIGNWISYRGEKDCWVASIGYEFATEYPDCGTRNGSDDLSDYSGIPLTPEWLERFGFNRLEPIKGNYDRIVTQFSYNNGDFVIEQVSGGFNLYSVAGMFCNLKKNIATTHSIIPHGAIRYVHQLQNLYFCLTGQELTPNK